MNEPACKKSRTDSGLSQLLLGKENEVSYQLLYVLISYRQIQIQDDIITFKLEPENDQLSAKIIRKSSNRIPNDDPDIRTEFLQKRFGHMQPEAAIMKPNDAFIFMKTDSKAINQGRCYYNPDSKIYFNKLKKTVAKTAKDTTSLEIERFSGEKKEHAMIEFYITGKRYFYNASITHKLSTSTVY